MLIRVQPQREIEALHPHSSIDILNTLMLLSWSEYKNNRIPGDFPSISLHYYSCVLDSPAALPDFRQFCQMAVNMATYLGLMESSPPPLQMGDPDAARKRATWSGMVQLNLTLGNCA
jgi:hypothetical protein